MKHAAVDNEKSVKVLTFYQQLFEEGLSDLNDNTPWDSFYNGQAGLWFGGVWEAGHHLGNEDTEIGIMPLPPIFGSAAHWGSSHTLVIPAYVSLEEQEGAMDFMKYFSEVGGHIWGRRVMSRPILISQRAGLTGSCLTASCLSSRGIR